MRSEEHKRLIDQAGDASWGALRFADEGLSFLKEAYPVQWATADTILKRIDDEKLQADIDRIAGKQFLENVRKRHVTYSAMVKRILIKVEEAKVDLAGAVRALGSAIVTCATKVCAHVEADELETLVQARAALQPIDLHREANAKKSTPEAAPQTPPAEPAGEP